MLELLHPAVAFRDCQLCQKYKYNEETGILATWGPDNEPLPRGPKGKPPCRTASGCPKGTPENPLSLSPKNQQAVWHNLQCEAVGCFPDDGLVRRNAALILDARRQAEAALQRRTQIVLSRIAGALEALPTSSER